MSRWKRYELKKDNHQRSRGKKDQNDDKITNAMLLKKNLNEIFIPENEEVVTRIVNSEDKK